MRINIPRGILAALGAAEAPEPSAVSVDQVPGSTLDLIYQAAIMKIDQQKHEVDFLDTKAIGILTAASLVVTVAPAARLSSIAARGAPVNPVAIALLVLAGVAYALLMWSIRSALQERLFDFPPSPKELWDDWWDQPVTEVKGIVIDTIAGAYEANRAKIRLKVAAISNALWLIFAESILLVAGLVAS